METREEAKKKAEALAKAQAVGDTEDAKKWILVVPAKMKVMNAKNKVKAALAQIKDSIEEFSTTTDSTYKEAAASNIVLNWKRLVAGEGELISTTDKLAEILSETDSNVTESDAIATIESNIAIRDELLEDWKAVRRQNQDYLKAAKELADKSNVDIEIQSIRTPVVQ